MKKFISITINTNGYKTTFKSVFKKKKKCWFFWGEIVENYGTLRYNRKVLLKNRFKNYI